MVRIMHWDGCIAFDRLIRSIRFTLTFNGHVMRKLHIGFDDPDAFTGPEGQVIEEFRRVRDEIRREMNKL